MKIIDVVRGADSKNTIYALLNAYIDELRHSVKREHVAPQLLALPIDGEADLRARLTILFVELDIASKRLTICSSFTRRHWLSSQAPCIAFNCSRTIGALCNCQMTHVHYPMEPIAVWFSAEGVWGWEDENDTDDDDDDDDYDQHDADHDYVGELGQGSIGCVDTGSAIAPGLTNRMLFQEPVVKAESNLNDDQGDDVPLEAVTGPRRQQVGDRICSLADDYELALDCPRARR
jgi:hypothetical protein